MTLVPSERLLTLLGFFEILISLASTYVWQCHRLTTSSSPPSRKFFLPGHSSRGSPLVGDPINSGKAICRVVISSCSSDTGGKLSAVDTFNPRYNSLVYKCSIGVVDVVNSELNMDFLVGVKYVWLKLNGLTLILCPRWKILELMPSLLHWKSYITNKYWKKKRSESEWKKKRRQHQMLT